MTCFIPLQIQHLHDSDILQMLCGALVLHEYPAIPETAVMKSQFIFSTSCLKHNIFVLLAFV